MFSSPVQSIFRPVKMVLQSIPPVHVWKLPLASSSADATAQLHATNEYESVVQPFSAIPGPRPLPVLRNLMKFRKNFFNLHLYFEECSEKYGEIFKLETPGS